MNVFPSLRQRFLFIVLELARVDGGILNVIEGCYISSGAFAAIGGRAIRYLFHMESGIAQGCLLSGSMFAVGFNPFLLDMKRRIDDRGLGLTRACADDVAALTFGFAPLKNPS